MKKAGSGKPIQLQQANRTRPPVKDVYWQRAAAQLMKKTQRERMRSYSLGTENRHVKEKNRELVNSNQALKLQIGSLIKDVQESKAGQYEMSLTINDLQRENRLLSEVLVKNDRDLTEAMSNLVKTSHFMTSMKETINKARKSKNRSLSKEYFQRWTSCDLQNVGAEQRYLNRAENLQTGTVNPMVQGMPLLKPKLHIQRVIVPEESAPDHRQNMSPVREEDPVEGDMEKVIMANQDSSGPRSRSGMQFEFLPVRSVSSDSPRIQNHAESQTEPATPKSVPIHLEPVVRLSDVSRLLLNSTVANILQQTEQSCGSNEEQIARAENFTGAQRYFLDESSVAQREHFRRTPEKSRLSYGEQSCLFSSDLCQVESRDQTSIRADYDPMEGSSWMHQDSSIRVPKRRMRLSNLGRRENKRQFVIPSRSTYSESHLSTRPINETQDLSDETYFNSNDVDGTQSEVTPSKASDNRLGTSPSDSTINTTSKVSLSDGLRDDHGMQNQNPFVRMSFLDRIGATSFKEINDSYDAEKSDFHMAEDNKNESYSPVNCIPSSVTMRRKYSMLAQKSLEYRERKSFPESTSLSDESESPLMSEWQPLATPNDFEETAQSAAISSRDKALVIKPLLIPEIQIIVEKLPKTVLAGDTISSQCDNEDTSAAVAVPFVELPDVVMKMPKQARTRVTTRARSKTPNTRSRSAAPNKRMCNGEVASVDTTTQATQLKRSKNTVGDKIKRVSDLLKPRTKTKKRKGKKQLNRRSSTYSRSSSNSYHSKTGRKSIEVEESPPQPRFNVGYHAVCDGCGQHSVDFNRCRQCHKKLPPDVASVPVGDLQLNQCAVICGDSLRLAQSSETSFEDNQRGYQSQAPPITVEAGATTNKLRAHKRKVAPRNLAEPTLKCKLRQWNMLTDEYRF